MLCQILTHGQIGCEEGRSLTFSFFVDQARQVYFLHKVFNLPAYLFESSNDILLIMFQENG